MNIQRCSIENQKGTITVQSLWRYHPSGSQRNSTDDMSIVNVSFIMPKMQYVSIIVNLSLDFISRFLICLILL